jgi:nucleoside-specific outer membrane channel protein Tsx
LCATVIGWNTKNIKLNLILFCLCISLKYLIAIAQFFAERAANLEYLSFKAFESSGWVAMFIYICISTFGTKSETLGIAMVIGEQLNTPLPW